MFLHGFDATDPPTPPPPPIWLTCGKAHNYLFAIEMAPIGGLLFLVLENLENQRERRESIHNHNEWKNKDAWMIRSYACAIFSLGANHLLKSLIIQRRDHRFEFSQRSCICHIHPCTKRVKYLYSVHVTVQCNKWLGISILEINSKHASFHTALVSR